jgi:phosphomannomutase
MEALMIGVSGMRGTIGGTLTPLVVSRMASAFAAWLKTQNKPANGKHFRIVVGRDSRPSGPWVRDAAVAALQASGVEVIDLEIVSTPGVAMMVGHTDADAGIVITASHNPIEWNGMKFLSRDQLALPPEHAKQVKSMYENEQTAFVPVHELVAPSRHSEPVELPRAAMTSGIGNLVPPSRNSETHALHVKRTLDYVDVLGISAKRFKVVLDSVNGAGCVTGATILSKLGCQLIHMNGTPNGQFPHEPEPIAKNLTGLCDEVRRQRAAVGFAQDPDADRLAVVDELGNFIGEEYSLALAAKLILSKKPGGVVVANLSTSRMIDDIAAQHGGRVVRTPVGEANVIQGMLRENSTIGGEGNGGVIDPRIVPGRDSLVAMAYTLQLMTNTGKTVSQLVADLPRYEIVKTKFECRREDADRAVEALKKEFASEKVDTQDGIRIDWHADRCWVHARPSNTEPIMRIIAEAPDQALAEKQIARVQAVVDKALGKI